MKSVVNMEEELLEHVGLAELACEENDTQVASVSNGPRICSNLQMGVDKDH